MITVANVKPEEIMVAAFTEKAAKEKILLNSKGIYYF